MQFPGHPSLGRGAVIAAGADAPAAFADAPRYCVDTTVLADPAKLADELARLWGMRQPYVIELAVPAAELARAESSTDEPWRLGGLFSFERERLNFLVWANNWDCRGDEAIWWRTRKALRLNTGAVEAAPDTEADLTLADGTDVVCDGGPRGPIPDLPEGLAVVHRESIECNSLRVTADVPPAPGGLAPDQLAAVAHGAGPARVIAPAGSGKTRVLTARLAHLLVDRRIEPATVTAVAYNRKAAEELKSRCASFGVTPHIRTIHSLALWILQRERPRSVLNERDVRRLLEGLVAVRPQPNTDVLAPFIEALAEVRIGLRDPAEVEAERDDVPDFADVYRRYRERLGALDAVDFDEQIYAAIELLLRDPAARAAAQHTCRHLLVDEFQDLTPSYLLLVRLLSSPARDVFAVGDDDQVIYGYAGATPRYLVNFSELFVGAAAYALEVNYRCPPAVVTAASELLGRNKVRVTKTITPAPGRADEGGSFVVHRVAASSCAADAADAVHRALDTGAGPGDIAVLARVNAALLPVQAALSDAGVACTSTIGPEVLTRTGMRAAFAWLRAALDPDTIDRADLSELVRRPARRLGQEVRDSIMRPKTSSVDDLWRLADALDGRRAERLHELCGDLERIAGLAARPGTTTAELFRAIRDDIGLGATLGQLDSSRTVADRSGHADDLDALVQAAALHPDPTTFTAWLRDVLGRAQSDTASNRSDERRADTDADIGPEVRPAPATSDTVLLSSVHRVKGREWDHVVVVGADLGLFPHARSSTDADSLEEERRIFHVAITRARRRCTVVADSARPSPFTDEAQGRTPPTPVVAPRNVPLRKTGSSNAPNETDIAALEGDPVWEALRTWRKQRAEDDGVPPYVVFSNAHLAAIARTRPTNLGELAECPGVGTVKLDRYGDEVLAIIDSGTG